MQFVKQIDSVIGGQNILIKPLTAVVLCTFKIGPMVVFFVLLTLAIFHFSFCIIELLYAVDQTHPQHWTQLNSPAFLHGFSFFLEDIEFVVLIAWWVYLTRLHIIEIVSSSNLKVLLFDYVEKCVAKGKKKWHTRFSDQLIG